MGGTTKLFFKNLYDSIKFPVEKKEEDWKQLVPINYLEWHLPTYAIESHVRSKVIVIKNGMEYYLNHE